MQGTATIDRVAVPSFANKSDAGDNAATTITIAADADGFHVLQQIMWGLDENPAAGSAPRLTVTIGGTEYVSVPISNGGAGFLDFTTHGNPISGVYNTARTNNQALVVSISAAGAGIESELFIRYV